MIHKNIDLMKLILSFAFLVITALADLRGTKSHHDNERHRQDQSTLPPPSKITGFQWINAATNQLYGTVVNDASMDLGEIPKGGLSIEAVTQGPIGSIQFRLESGGVYQILDSGARWFLCGSNGTDVLPCKFSSMPSRLTATAFASKNGTGPVVAKRGVNINFYQLFAPTLKLTLINHINVESSLYNNRTIGLASTPTMAVRLDFEGYKIWKPQSVFFSYDNRTVVRLESNPPFSFLGNNGSSYEGFTPSVGRHRITATAFSQKGAKGQSKTISVGFKVVAGV